MKYIKYKYEKEFTYVELAEGYAERQIMVHRGRYVASNREDKEMEFFLAEGFFDTEDLDGIEVIDKNEFEEIWEKYCKTLLPEWLKSKRKFIKGDNVTGVIKLFYPQGIIIEFEDKTLGIANYEECVKNSMSKNNLYPSHIIDGVVKDYDEINMWIIIEKARAY